MVDDKNKLLNNAKLNIDLIYPIGSIYMSMSDTDPSILFGGIWKQLKDRFLLGASDTYAAGSTGGEAQHTLTNDEMPKHRHEFNNFFNGYPKREYRLEIERYITPMSDPIAPSTNEGDAYTNYYGGSKPHNNMPPYLVVNMWERVS